MVMACSGRMGSAAREARCSDCGQTVCSPMAGSKAFGHQYCDHCWWRWSLLDERLCVPARYTGNAVRNFQGRTVHVFQVGLGTFGTFVKPDCGWMRILLDAPAKGSDRPPEEEDLLGIGVDCLEESVGPQEQLALPRRGCSVLLAAMDSSPGERTLWCLPRGTRKHVRDFLEQRGASLERRAVVDMELAYLENMSSVGEQIHPATKASLEKVQKLLLPDFRGALIESRTVPCLTYQDVLRQHNAAGCDIFVVDAEGMDCAIVGSMIDTCGAGDSSWPTLVCYETRGAPGSRTCRDEKMTMSRLEEAGYVVLDLGLDATFVHAPALEESSALRAWADKYFSLSCYICGWKVYPSDRDFREKVGRGSSQWQGTSEDQAFMRLHSKPWMLAGGTWCCSSCFEHGGTLSNSVDGVS